MEAEKWVNWTTCIKKTDNPEILNLEDCYKDPGYLNTCWDGVLNITRFVVSDIEMLQVLL